MQTSPKAQIRSGFGTPDTYDLQNLVGTLLVQRDISMIKISVKIRCVFPEISAKLWNNALFRNVEESFKNSCKGKGKRGFV